MAEPRVSLPIDGDPRKARAAIAETIRGLEGMQKAVNAYSATGVRAFRAEAEASRALLTQLGATQREHEKLNTVVSRFESQAESAKSRVGASARTMAMGFENLARSGNLAGEGMKQVVAQAADMAFMFGSTGPIVGAIGIAALAIFSLFDRTRREAAETTKKLKAEMQEIRRMSLDSAQELATTLFSGDPLADEGAAERRSIPEMQAELARLNAEIAKQQGIIDKASATTSSAAGATVLLRQAEKERADLLEILTPREQKHAEAMATVNRMAAKAVEFETTLAGIRADERAAKEADKADEKELSALGQRVGLLSKLVEHEGLRADALFHLIGIEHGLRTALATGNMDLERRLVLLDLLARAEEARRKARPEIREQDPLEPAGTSIGVGIGREDSAAIGQVFADIEAGAANLPSIWERVQLAIRGATGETLHLGDALGEVAVGALGGLTDAAGTAFAAIVTGSAESGARATAAMRQLAVSSADLLAKHFVGQALASFASVTAPPPMGPNPGGVKAGLGYLAAAAAMKGIGAAIAAGGAGSGGGGGGLGRGSIAGDGTALGTIGRGKATVTIRGHYLDMTDPRGRQALADAIKDLVEGRDIEFIFEPG